MAKAKKGGKQGKAWVIWAGIAAVAVVVIVVAAALAGGGSREAVQPPSSTKPAVVNQDLVIPISEISGTAGFYPAEVDGTRLEVIAVKAADGTIRTAFNTCQVCYSSGRGYYKQEGSVLVCQNCGNRFSMEQVELSSGGCNPVPIFSENKTVTAESIIISKEYLAKAKAIFANWKTGG
ncbi:MAG: DUF2318 domain-containing protein [Clostridium sp.]|jgi:uncharacterized membrane protein|nr:DUF2318 domain-containing protein [Clostridium sp.]